MKSVSPNTKIDFRKLLAIVHGLPNGPKKHLVFVIHVF